MNKKTLNNIASFIIVVVISVITIFILSKISPDNSIQTAIAPIVELPINATTTNVEISVSKLLLTLSPYTPSLDVLSNPEAYKSQSVRLILNGNFSLAKLHINGLVTEDGSHFLSIVYFVYNTVYV